MAAMSSEVPRRTALLGSVAMAGLASAPPSMAFGGPDLFDKINAAIQPKVVDGSLGISFDEILRLVYHDTITYSRESNTGGLNGSIRFPEELARPENAGLAPVVDKLTNLQKDIQAATGLPISFSDVMVLTCQLIAARDFKINLCSKTDEASCETLYNGFGNKPKKLRVGRVDAKKPEPMERPIPWIGTSGTDIIQTNALIGLTIPETLSIANGILPAGEAQTIEVLANDPRTEKPIRDLENAKTSTTRTNYEVKFFQTLIKLSNISVFNEDQYKK